MIWLMLCAYAFAFAAGFFFGRSAGIRELLADTKGMRDGTQGRAELRKVK